MKVREESIVFDEEDRWVAGLPECMPIQAAGAAFGVTRRARSQCYDAFHLLLTCDIETLTNEQVASLPLFPDRLRRLDRLSERFIPFVMPQIISEFEQL